MHNYLRAVGFRSIRSARASEQLMRETILHHDRKRAWQTSDGFTRCEFIKQYAAEIGLVVCGEFDEDGNLHPQHMFPFYKGPVISMKQPIEFELHSADESYGAICDDPRIGTSIIFHLINAADMIYAEDGRKADDPIKSRQVRFSALAKEGSILLPIFKTHEEEAAVMAQRERYLKLVSEAREGDEEAIEELTEDDMNNFNILMKRVQREDILSIVETYFQPSGIECDLYSICGNVIYCEQVRNGYTHENIWKMKVEACDVFFSLCINEKDLEGMPAPGTRFRGRVWLQGFVEF